MVNCVCKQCGKEFEIPYSWVKKGGGKFCSKECHNISQTVYKAKPCEYCGNEFKPTKTKKRFCTTICWYKWHSESCKVEKICKQCGKLFKIPQYYPNKKRGLFCSTDCKKIYSRDKFENETNLNFRQRVFKFFPNVCVLCGSTENLVAHHIIPQEYEKNIKFNRSQATGKGNHKISNGCIVCTKCHKGIHNGQEVLSVG